MYIRPISVAALAARQSTVFPCTSSKPSFPLCNPLTVHNVGAGCDVTVTPFLAIRRPPINFSNSSLVIDAPSLTKFTFGATPKAGFGTPVWSGTAGNPPTFTESLFGGAHSVSVTCPSLCPNSVGDNDNQGCTYDGSTTFSIAIVCDPAAGGILKADVPITVDSCNSCFCEQQCLSVCGTNFSTTAFGEVCVVSGSPTEQFFGPCEYYGQCNC
jgi:hypothetical protein